jgi:predicted TIM-barrel fold metal-dependent hydrolase
VDETDESAAPVPAQSTGAELPHGEPSQIEELTDVVADTSEIAGAAGYNRELTVLPFYCMDPRSYPDGAGARAAMASAEAAGYAGVKIYSPLGYLPADPRLADVFELCLEDGLPVLAHCGRGGAGHKGAVNLSDLAHPYNWIPVLDHLEAKYHGTTLPNGPFRLCLAHFDSLEDDADFAWWDEIINLIEKYLDSRTVRVYVDVSANYPGRRRVARRYFDRLSSRVFGDSRLERRLLFGSDWWMQLYSVSETEYLYTYFERYAGRRFYPEPSGGESLEELFEANAKEYLGRWY